MANAPRILVVGAGAVGSYYGARLSQAGAHVTLLCRSDYETVKRDGIHIKSVKGDCHFVPAGVVSSASAYKGQADYVMVTLKALPGIDVPSLIRDAVSKDTAIFLLQNGIGFEQPVKTAFPDNELIVGTAYISVSRTSCGHVSHQDFGNVTVGAFPQGTSKKTEILAELFRQGGVDCALSNNTLWTRWEKLVWNVPFNCLSVVLEADTRRMMDDPMVACLAERLMKEVQTAARAAGHEIDDATIQRKLDLTRKMLPFKTSMLQDFEAGREMEVEAILGRPVAIADQLGVPVPHMKTILALLGFKNKRQ